MDEKTDLIEQMPRTIGRYEIQECIGFGAMGAVYKAFDPLIKRTLAIKTIRLDIPKSSPQYDSFIKRFYHEARISGTLNHPNIVTLFDIGEEGGSPFLAMEYVAGETIASIIDSGERFDAERVVGLISQIAAAVDYAHSKTVVHRDIKPSNLILSEGDRVKVTDFGIAKLADTEMTQSGVLLGTPSYMSPEQAMGEDLDGRSDIFSLGVCAFEMLSGEQPFPGPNVTSILYKLVHVDPIEPSELELHGLVPQKWHDVFQKVLAKRPDDRYQTAAEFVQDLEYCLGSWFGSAMSDAPTGASYVAVTESLPASNAPAPSPSPEPEDDLPQTVLMSAQIAETPTADFSAADLGRGKAAEAPPAAPPSPEPEEEPATVILAAPPAPSAPAVEEELPATVLMGAVAVPEKPPEETPGEGATVLMAAPDPQELATRAVSAPPTPPPTEPVRRAPGTPGPRPPTPPPAPTVTHVQRPGGGATGGRPRTVPVALIVGVALVFLVAIGVGILALVKLRAALVERAAQSKVAVATPTPEPEGGQKVTTGFLRVTTQPIGAAVSVNGEPRGAAPLEMGLPLGLYEVQVTHEGYVAQTHAVEITATKPVSDLDLRLEAVVPVRAAQTAPADILSDPPAARVLVDGREVGQTPLRGFDLTVGNRRIELRKKGFASERRNVRVAAGRPVSLRVALSPVAPPPTAARAPEPEPEPVDVHRIYFPREVDQKPKKVSGDYPDPTGLPKLRSGERVSVSVAYVVTEKGKVTDVEIIESGGGKRLNEAVKKAVEKWRFEPGVKGGTKVKVRQTQKFTYQVG